MIFHHFLSLNHFHLGLKIPQIIHDTFLNVPVVFPAGDGAGSQEDQLCTALVSQLNKFADKETLIQFLRCFLLESNSSSVRWQAHCLALHIYRYLEARIFS